MTQSGYFRLATIVVLDMEIADGKLIFCHGISEQNNDKTISMREYNDRKFYGCFNNPFPVYGGSPALNLPPVPIDDSPCTNKRARHTSDLLPAAISVTSENSVGMLITPSDSPQLLVPNYDDPDIQHTIMSDNPCHDRGKIGYCSRFYYGKRHYKNEVLLLHVFN